MPGRERQQAARARLVARRGRRSDRELIDETLADIHTKVEERGSVDEADPEKIASDELMRTRADKRAQAWLASHR